MRKLAQALALLAGVCWSAEALAGITTGAPAPAPNSLQVDSFVAKLTVASPRYAITTVTATVNGVTTPLALKPVGDWEATIDLTAFPEGPTTITYLATNANGETSSQAVTFRHDLPPKVSVAAPMAWQFYPTLGPTARVTVSCTDTATYPCDHIIVAGVVGGPMTIVSDSVDQDLTIHTDLTITVVDTAGSSTTMTVPQVQDATPTLTILLAVPGRILDVDATRVLYTNASGLYVRDRATSADTRVGDDVGDAGTAAFTISGAFPDGHGVSANGRYYAMSDRLQSHSIPRTYDLQTGTSVGCTVDDDVFGASDFTRMLGVTNAGIPAYLTRRTEGEDPTSLNLWVCAGGNEFRPLSPGVGSGPLVLDALLDDGVYVWAHAHGGVLAFPGISWSTIKGTEHVLVADGPTPPNWAMTGSSSRQEPAAHRDFDTSCGYFTYTATDGADVATFVKTPAGTVQKRSIWSGYNTLDGLGPNGEVIVGARAPGASGRYITRDGQAPLLFAQAGRSKWVNGAWLDIAGNTVLWSTASPGGGPIDCAGGVGPMLGGGVAGGGAGDAGADASTDAGVDASADASSADAGASSDASMSADATSVDGDVGTSSTGASSSGASSSASTASGSGGEASGDDGAGCSTAGGSGNGALSAVAIVLALTFSRRRRRDGRSHRCGGRLD